MNRFYGGAARIEKATRDPRFEKFMDALTMWWLVMAGVFVVLVVTLLLIVGVTILVGVLS